MLEFRKERQAKKALLKANLETIERLQVEIAARSEEINQLEQFEGCPAVRYLCYCHTYSLCSLIVLNIIHLYIFVIHAKLLQYCSSARQVRSQIAQEVASSLAMKIKASPICCRVKYAHTNLSNRFPSQSLLIYPT